MVSESTQQKIEQLQYMQQNLAQFAQQRQTFQSQLMEVDSALHELQSAKTAYKIVGNIMVGVDASNLQQEMQERQEVLKLRIGTIEKQELKLKEKAEDIEIELKGEVS